MLRRITVDVAYVFIPKIKVVGVRYMDGEMVELVDNEVEVHGGRGADSPYGNGLTLLVVGEGEPVVYPTRCEVFTGGVEVLLGNLNGLQGIKDFFHMIPCKRQKDGYPPGLSANVHCKPGPNHGFLLRRRGNIPMEQDFRPLPSWRTTDA